MDPLKDDYPYYTPYQYAGNQPIVAIDLDGLEPAHKVEDKKEFSNEVFDMQQVSDDLVIETNTITGEQRKVKTGTFRLDEVTVVGKQNWWQKTKAFFKKAGETILDGLQLVLDIVGLIPAVGNIADLLNAGISALRGDFVGAGLSLAAAIPLAGLFAGGAKVVRSGAKLINKGIKSSKKTIQSGKNLLKNTKKVEKNRKLTDQVDEVARSEFIPYKNSNALITTANATKDVIENAARQIYKDYPEILKALKL